MDITLKCNKFSLLFRTYSFTQYRFRFPIHFHFISTANDRNGQIFYWCTWTRTYHDLSSIWDMLRFNYKQDFSMYHLSFYSCVSSTYNVRALEAAPGGGSGPFREGRGRSVSKVVLSTGQILSTVCFQCNICIKNFYEYTSYVDLLFLCHRYSIPSYFYQFSFSWSLWTWFDNSNMFSIFSSWWSRSWDSGF